MSNTIYPESWSPHLLGSFGRVVGGGTPSRSQSRYWKGFIPWASVKDFTDDAVYLKKTAEHISHEGLVSSAATLVPEGTPVLCTRMAVGRCALTTEPTAINQDLKAFLLAGDIDRHFFIRLLRHHGPQLDRVSVGSTVRGITLGDLLTHEVFCPADTLEQARIAIVLDTIDQAIAKTEAVIAKLKHVRAGLLHDLLTHGLDENGELRDPVAHPEQFKDSPLGRIPKDWEVIPLGGLSTFVTSGSRGWANYYSEDGPVFLRIGNLTREHINFRLNDIVRVRPPSGSEGARTRVQPGDVLISITADLGIIGVIPNEFEEAYVNQHIALVRPLSSNCPRWIGRYLAFGPTATHFRMLNDSGAKAGMNLSAVESLQVALPTKDEQDASTIALDSIDQDIAQQLQAEHKLRHIKSGLTPDLIVGRVEVPEEAVRL